MTTIAKRFGDYITKEGTTQEDLAVVLGTTLWSVRQWCSGATVPRNGILQKFATLSGVSFSDLVKQALKERSVKRTTNGGAPAKQPDAGSGGVTLGEANNSLNLLMAMGQGLTGKASVEVNGMHDGVIDSIVTVDGTQYKVSVGPA